MSVHQAAGITEAADRDLDGIGVVEVPDVWPPLDAAPMMIPALAAEAVTAGRARPPAAERSWSQPFAVLLAETLTGARPVQQILPWLAKRGSVQLHRLLPLFSSEHRPRVLRVLTTMPGPDVVEMTMVVLIGPRARALAVRLERAAEAGRTGRPDKLATRWLCTDIEAG
jgi:Family of unknown function (DUF6459)